MILLPRSLTYLLLHTELYILIIASFVYTTLTHISLYKQSPPASRSVTPSQLHRTTAQRPTDGRDIRRPSAPTNSPVKKDHFSFVWMTVPKNYR